MTASQNNEPEREIRFATVIYGGVSLAIYINGIVQEMLHLVRSTAIDEKSGKPIPWENLNPVERVYRTLSTMVGTPAAESQTRQAVAPTGSGKIPRRSHRPGTAGLCADFTTTKGYASVADMVDSRLKAGDARVYHPIRTRFVVDVLSGTSAGGINAIFLAKALVSNLSIKSLAKMWILDADLNKLLNDEKITPKFLQQKPPQALLNARWMYMELLLALKRMNKAHSPWEPCTLVDDLDLYCTTTDLFGLPVQIALTDESVTEVRFRNFYHFKRRINTSSKCESPHADPHTRSSINDLAETDPFLAFAARCTSSFPFAFEPMRLQHAFDIIQSDPRFKDYLLPVADPGVKDLFGPGVARLQGAGKFQEICSVYSDGSASADKPEGFDLPFSQRPFGDGGYLDNKPFSYAIETIKTRHAFLPVDRKLIYIEPSPESMTGAAPGAQSDGKIDRPNAIQNSLDALVVLPRYETIRQDIESVIEWNANISRFHRVLDHFEQEIEASPPAELRGIKKTLAYDSYWRLRLSGAADQLADRIADSLGTTSTSAEGQAIRSIVGTWREERFGRVASHELDKPGLRRKQQRFLDLFDFDFCERELRFLREHLQRLPNDDTREGLRDLAPITIEFMTLINQQPELSLSGAKLECWEQYLRFIVDPKAASRALGCPLPGESPNGRDPMPIPDPEFLSVTDAGRDCRVKWLMNNDASVEVLSASECRCESSDFVKFSQIVDEMATIVVKFYADQLTYNPNPDSDPVTPREGKTKLQILHDKMTPLFERIKVPVRHDPGTVPISGWEFFCVQDVLVYPMIFGTELGEFESVEIFRISPQETRPIANTSPDPDAKVDDNPPLRGDAVWAFGGFLDESWRLNDMLRGRLDGAERLITAILPDSDPHTVSVREHLIQAALEAVAEDWKQFAAEVGQ